MFQLLFSPTLCIVRFFNFSHSGGYIVVYQFCFLIFTFLISSDVEYLGPESDGYLGSRLKKS